MQSVIYEKFERNYVGLNESENERFNDSVMGFAGDGLQKRRNGAARYGAARSPERVTNSDN